MIKFEMPKDVPKKSACVRKSDRSKLHAYTQLPVWDLNQALEITKFENLLESFDLSNRVYEERLSKESLT